MTDRVLQIVPRPPGSRDGVGDYALSLARLLRDEHELTSIFAVNERSDSVPLGGVFEVRNGLPDPALEKFERIIVHYANYGYDRFGIPSDLNHAVAEFRRQGTSRCVTMFHEIYASGPPWRSAFWTRPFQVKVARKLVDSSTACVVSNTVIRDEIKRHASSKPVFVVPVMSNFGEGDPIRPKDLRHWAVCGGTALIERSLRGLLRCWREIPPEFSPARVTVVGGDESPTISRLLEDAKKRRPNVMFERNAAVSSEEAAELLAGASWGFMDYFGSGKVWPGMIFKSGSFAALCAHGVIPVFRHEEPVLSLNGEELPGPFFCSASASRFPGEKKIEWVRTALRAWYQHNASARHTAAVYAEALR